jgi:catechol 2,3-dioxygenase-like lactoylglutathione lyase family enzyme
MKKITIYGLVVLFSFTLGSYNHYLFAQSKSGKSTYDPKKEEVKLGAFSMSLNVKDLAVSRKFYEDLGFQVFGGGMEKKYLILKNGNALIGIFQGFFEGNILTFNPGWDENAKNMKKYDDVREIQKRLKTKNIPLTVEADENSTGPAFVILSDPDGNVIYLDQHR